MRLKTDANQTSNAIFGAALLFAAPAIQAWTITGPTFDTFDQIVIAGCTILALMAIWARFYALPPAIIALICWIAFFAWLYGPIARAGKMRPFHWVVCASISILLTLALVSALQRRVTVPSQTN